MTAIVLRGDAAHLPLPDGSVDLIVTSPPYFGLRSYTDAGEHYDGQIGSEETAAEYIAALIECTREWMRVLKPSGSLFVNLGDKYAGGGQGGHLNGGPHLNRTPASARNVPQGFREKSLMGLPWRYALACTDDLSLILRRDIIWHKPNGLPESVTDRCRTSHEYLFHFTTQPRYFAAVDEIRETYSHGSHGHRKDGSPAPGDIAVKAFRGVAGGPTRLGGSPEDRNQLGKLPGSVWGIPSQPLIVPDWLDVDHFAAFPMELPRRVILGWSPPGICIECGEGRRPVVDRTNRPLQRVYNGTLTKVPGAGRQDYRTGVPQITEATITGYACTCPEPTAPTHPAIVADPFGGTGATALVADVLGRTGITVDRSMSYCRLARWRTSDPGERARAMNVPKPPSVAAGQGSLFDDLEAS